MMRFEIAVHQFGKVRGGQSSHMRVIRFLHNHGAVSQGELQLVLGIKAATMSELISRLEEQQIIRGYHADINATAAGYEIEAVVLATARASAEESLYRLIEDRPEVVAAWDLAGRTGLLLRVICKDMASFEALVESFQQAATTESYFCLHQRKGTQFPVEDL